MGRGAGADRGHEWRKAMSKEKPYKPNRKAIVIHYALKVALWQLTHDRNVRTFDAADVESRVRRMLPDIPPAMIREQVGGTDNSRQVLGYSWKDWATR
jgi:hypothetical protein